MFAVTFLTLVLVASCQAACDGGCDVPVKHYEELGCEPVYAKPGDCCPQYYDCAKIEGRAADKCYFAGKAYNIRDRIDNEVTTPHCAASCYCEKGTWKDITCANIECPEHMGIRPGPGCFSTYENGHCCATGTICEPEKKKNLAKCEVNGKTYYEGQRFYPENDDCMSCTCKSGFEGKFVEPFCSQVSCGIELRYSADVRKNYAPIYYGTSKCCPNGWQSPDEIDKITPAEKPSTEGKRCKFGDKELNVGDKVILKKSSPHSPDIDCECKIPPLATCTQKPYETN